VLRVLDVVGEFAGFAIEPDVADHPVLVWRGARRECRVTDDGLGVGVLVVGVRVDRALFEQMAESALAEAVAIAAQEISA